MGIRNRTYRRTTSSPGQEVDHTKFTVGDLVRFLREMKYAGHTVCVGDVGMVTAVTGGMVLVRSHTDGYTWTCYAWELEPVTP